jgi:hypothetical protein
MFGTIRKHSTVLWVPIVVLTSISMVWFFTSDVSLFSGPTATGDFGSINGRPISAAEFFDAKKEVRLSAFLHGGKWPDSDATSESRTDNEAISRVFIVQKLKEMDIKASEKAVAMMVHEQLRDYPYEQFEKEHLKPQGLTLADYDRLVRNESAIRQLVATASVSARLVQPAEAEGLWRKENQELSAQLAVFWTSNHLDKVTITNGAIGSFYTNRMALYRLPERLLLSYVEFPASNYTAEAASKIAKLTNLNEIVSDYYFRGRADTNRWVDTNGAPLSEAAAKEKIKEEFHQNEALLAARRVANEFGNELMNQTNANSVAALDRLAAAKGLAIKATRPFDSRTNGLEEIPDDTNPFTRADDSLPETVRDTIRKEAFALTDERPVLFRPIPGKHAVYVIARRGKVPSEMQPLEKIQDKVTTDYRNFMALELARKAGQSFHTNLTNGLALKKNFADLCAAERVKTIDLPPFSAGTRSLTNLDTRINLRMLQNMAQDLEVGAATLLLPAQPPSEGSYILYAKARPPIDEAKLKTALPEYLAQMRVYRQNEAFQAWFRKQVEQAKVLAPKRETAAGVGAPN